MTSAMVTVVVNSVCHVEVIHVTLLTLKNTHVPRVTASCDPRSAPVGISKMVSAPVHTDAKHAVCTIFHLVNTDATCASVVFASSGCLGSIFA